MDIDDRDAIARSILEAVKTTSAELEGWLGTDGSRAGGWIHEKDPVGHLAGARTVPWRGDPRATCATRDGGTRS